MEETTEVGREKLKAVYRTLEELAVMADACADDRKSVKAICKVWKRRDDLLKETVFPLPAEEKSRAGILSADLGEALKKLLGAKEVEEFKAARLRMKDCLDRVRAEIEKSDPPKPTIRAEAIIGKAKAVGEAARDALSDTARSIGETIERGTAKLKKTIEDLGSK